MGSNTEPRNSDITELKALSAETEENTALVQALYAMVIKDPRSKSWPNFQAVNPDDLEKTPDPAR